MKSETEPHRTIADMPFTPFADVQVRPFVEGRTGWTIVRDAVESRLASV